eukprot:NODE_801_length_3816_cov_0.708905.p3 type:complete len:138 gc:universal NODE_801_length_3816_cov_0.708905:476-63(-)
MIASILGTYAMIMDRGLVGIFDFSNMNTNNIVHVLFGVLSLILMICQIGLGFYIDKKYNPTRKYVPTRDKLHWTIGYSLILIGIFNIMLQINSENMNYLLWIVGMGFMVGIMTLLGNMRREHPTEHHENDSKTQQME